MTIVTIRQAVPARGLSIDPYLAEDEKALLYATWEKQVKAGNWPEMLKYSGGVQDITTDMILEIPEGEFKKAFGRRKKNINVAGKIWEAAKRHG